MSNNNVYPAWIDDKEIINLLLKNIKANGGSLSYTSVINPEFDRVKQERLKRIIAIMRHEELLELASREGDDLRFGRNAREAVVIGYAKFKRRKRLTWVIKCLILLVLIGIIYMVSNHFKLL